MFMTAIAIFAAICAWLIEREPPPNSLDQVLLAFGCLLAVVVAVVLASVKIGDRAPSIQFRKYLWLLSAVYLLIFFMVIRSQEFIQRLKSLFREFRFLLPIWVLLVLLLGRLMVPEWSNWLEWGGQFLLQER
jgi:hypothetical protein